MKSTPKTTVLLVQLFFYGFLHIHIAYFVEFKMKISVMHTLVFYYFKERTVYLGRCS